MLLVYSNLSSNFTVVECLIVIHSCCTFLHVILHQSSVVCLGTLSTYSQFFRLASTGRLGGGGGGGWGREGESSLDVSVGHFTFCAKMKKIRKSRT